MASSFKATSCSPGPTANCLLTRAIGDRTLAPRPEAHWADRAPQRDAQGRGAGAHGRAQPAVVRGRGTPHGPRGFGRRTATSRAQTTAGPAAGGPAARGDGRHARVP